MQNYELLERIVRLESQMQNQISSVDKLTVAVNNLNSILQQGRGMRVLVGIVLLVFPFVSSVIGVLSWLRN